MDLQETRQHLLQQAVNMAAAAHAKLTDSQAAMSGASQAGGADPPHGILWPYEPIIAFLGHQGCVHPLPSPRQSPACSDLTPDVLQAWRHLPHCSPLRCWRQQRAAQPWRTAMPGSWLLQP